MRKKPTVYLETNIFSSLTYRGGGAVASIRQLKMAEWWELERKNFRLYTSDQTEEELLRGKYANQFQAIGACRRITYLELTSKVRECAKLLIAEKLIPASEYDDALHLATATIYRVEYLMTWNQAHLANPVVQQKMAMLTRQKNWRSPWLVSPESIPWNSMGQEIRRSDA